MLCIKRLRQVSSESGMELTSGLLDYGRRRSRRFRNIIRPSSPRSRRVRVDDIETNKFMEVLLFCSVMVLWMSGLVMLAFGFYLVLSQYGWAVLTRSTMYWIGMILQTVSAVSVLIAAGVTTTLLTPDIGSPKRALLGFIIVVISAILLISEIIVCALSKKNQRLKAEGIYSAILTTKNKTLSEEDWKKARKMGYECQDWDDKECKRFHNKLTENNLNFLIGSASVTLAILILVVPVLYLVYRSVVRKITRVRPTALISERSIEPVQ